MTPKRILITGASGFIGGAVLRKLRGLSPVAVYHNTKPAGEHHSLKSVDLRDAEAVRALMKEVRPEIVYHFAALTSPKRNEAEPELARENNLTATSNLVKHLPVSARLVFTSTDKVFDGSDADPDENAPTTPQWLYARLKVECENLIRSRVPRHHVVRLGIVHSLGEGSGAASAVDGALARLRRGEKAEVFGNVERTFVRLDRLVDLFELMLADDHFGLYHAGTPMMSYHARVKQLCGTLGIASENLLVPVAGSASPMSQNLNTRKLSSTFKIAFD